MMELPLPEVKEGDLFAIVRLNPGSNVNRLFFTLRSIGFGDISIVPDYKRAGLAYFEEEGKEESVSLTPKKELEEEKEKGSLDQPRSKRRKTSPPQKRQDDEVTPALAQLFASSSPPLHATPTTPETEREHSDDLDVSGLGATNSMLLALASNALSASATSASSGSSTAADADLDTTCNQMATPIHKLFCSDGVGSDDEEGESCVVGLASLAAGAGWPSMAGAAAGPHSTANGIVDQEPCSICQSVISGKSTMKLRHVRGHCSRRPFRCPVEGCGREATQMTHIKSHYMRIHGQTEGPYPGCVSTIDEDLRREWDEVGLVCFPRTWHMPQSRVKKDSEERETKESGPVIVPPQVRAGEKRTAERASLDQLIHEFRQRELAASQLNAMSMVEVKSLSIA